MNPSKKPEVITFFEPQSHTFSYVVKDPDSNACAIIDSVLDFDYAAGQVSYHSADEIIECVKKRNLEVTYLIETHVHADHLSAAPYIQHALGGKIGISEKISTVQKTFGQLFNEGNDFQRDGSQFDILFTDNQPYKIGQLDALAMHTPGHTPACMAHSMGDAVFVGDTLFMPDAGTARADFPGGNAGMLYQSIHKILSLPSQTRMFICHDYQPNGRELAHETTVGQQKKQNIHIREGICEQTFVGMREARDRLLAMPTLIFPALQTNMRAGYFPPPANNQTDSNQTDNNQTVYLKVPISGLKTPLAYSHKVKTQTKTKA